MMHDLNKETPRKSYGMQEANDVELKPVISEGVGHVEQLQRNFSVWSVIGVAFSLANSWFGISTALATGINSGGPVLLVYGIVFISIISLAIAVSLSELASAMPDAGAQYYWTSELAPRRYARFTSYLTGWIAWAGSVFTCASVALGVSSLCLGCIQLSHPELTIKPWMTFVGYQIINWICALFNLYSKTLPLLSNITLWISLVSFLVILIAIPAKSSTHQTPKFVFASFINGTGWNNNAIALIVGLINPNWAFNGLDCACHMAEEINCPERLIPIAIMSTVGIGFFTAWLFAISMMFSITDLEAVAGTATGTPILELFYQALGSKAGAIVLQVLIILTGCGCLIASHTWQARLCWSFARDNGLPGSKWLARVHPKADVPVYAHIVSTSIVSVLGCLYLGSYTAFNSMVTACVVLLYTSYSIPVLCLLAHGRDNIRHGPFWLGQIGKLCNYVLLLWNLFTLVMYSFPAIQPVQADNMNYVSIVYVVTIAIVMVDWFTRAQKAYVNAEPRSPVLTAAQ